MHTPIPHRWRILAGPFFESERGILNAIEKHLAETGARTMKADERGGLSLFRLRSECETMEETAARLRRKH